MYKITIGVPAYNAQHTIKQTLKSITTLTNLSEIQVIIVDDASEVSYIDVVNEFKPLFSIELIRLCENRGPGFARNVILNKCQTEFVAFIDADDEFIAPDFLVTAIEQLTNNPHSPFYMSYFYTESMVREKIPTLELDWLHGKVYRLSAINNQYIRFPDTSFMEDFEFNLELFLSHHNHPIKNDTVTYLYHTNPNSILGSFKSYTELWLRSIRVGVDIRNRVLGKSTLIPEKVVDYITQDLIKYYSLIEYINDKYHSNKEIMMNFLYRQLNRYYKKHISIYSVNWDNVPNNSVLDFKTFYYNIINPPEKKSL